MAEPKKPTKAAAKKAPTKATVKKAHVKAQTVPDLPPPSTAVVLGVLETLGSQVASLASKFRTLKRWQLWTAIGLAFDAALSLGFFYVADKIGQQSDAATVQCRAANELGEAQLKLWGPLLGTDKHNPGETDAAYATRQEFKATIEKLAKPKDCD